MDSEGKRIIFGFFGSIVSDCGGSKTVSAVHWKKKKGWDELWSFN